MTDRTRQARRALALTALAVPLLTAAPAAAAPVSVNLRVEGKTRTISEARITTDGHDVTTDSGGTHRCDGTNNGAHPSPGPTATAALDDAARLGGFTWDGDWFTADQGFDDYAVTRVGPDSQDPSAGEFWGYVVNFQDPGVGGCQVRVQEDNDVLWAYNGFGKPLLKLDAPASARTGEPFFVTVTDGQDGSPEGGASVGGEVTGPDGHAALSFGEKGVYRLKAERSDAIRSGAAVVCVDPPGAEPCTSSDGTPPTAQVLLPRYASETSRSRTFVVAWQGDDGPAGSGVSGYTLDVREPGVDWRPLLGKSAAVRKHFRGAAGRSYEFRVSAFDRAGLRSGFATDAVSVPIDDRDRKLWRISRGWRQVRTSLAWGGFALRPKRAGARARVSFSGTRVSLIGRRLAKGGRLRLSVGGRSRILRLRGRSDARQVLYTSSPLPAGRHTLRLTALGGGPVELDAVAPLP